MRVGADRRRGGRTIRCRLPDRSGPRLGLPLTEDPDVHLLVDGHRLDPVLRRGSTYAFRLRGRPLGARIISRVRIPTKLGTNRDPHPLGMPLQRIFLCQGARLRVIEADEADRSPAQEEKGRSVDALPILGEGAESVKPVQGQSSGGTRLSRQRERKSGAAGLVRCRP